MPQWPNSGFLQPGNTTGDPSPMAGHMIYQSNAYSATMAVKEPSHNDDLSLFQHYDVC